MPPALTNCTACPGLELLRCELLANPAAIADVLVLNVHAQNTVMGFIKQGRHGSKF
jgi:hypothetical protein